jgi:hypothetical protein
MSTLLIGVMFMVQQIRATALDHLCREGTHFKTTIRRIFNLVLCVNFVLISSEQVFFAPPKGNAHDHEPNKYTGIITTTLSPTQCFQCLHM